LRVIVISQRKGMCIMELTSPRMPPRITPGARFLLAALFVCFMSSLGIITNYVRYPRFDVMDSSVIVIGVFTGVVTALLLAALEIYIRRLERALDSVKILEGMLPICASCKRIRTSDDHCHVIETYIRERTHATFTHGMCPDCAKKKYGMTFDNT
jgi:hypothetical protein